MKSSILISILLLVISFITNIFAATKTLPSVKSLPGSPTKTLPTSEKKIKCENNTDTWKKLGCSGLYVDASFQPNCYENHYACFLKPITKNYSYFYNAVVAESIEECIEINGEYYCAADIDMTNITCSNKFKCKTFSEFVLAVKETLGEYFDYKNVDTSNLIKPIDILLPENHDYAIEPTEKIPDLRYCPTFAMVSEKQSNCLRRKGKYYEVEVGLDCEQFNVCFLPEGSSKINSDSIIAKDESECIFIPEGGSYSRYEQLLVYCAADTFNFSCPEGTECTFAEFVKETRKSIGFLFQYYNIDIDKYNKPIALPVLPNSSSSSSSSKIEVTSVKTLPIPTITSSTSTRTATSYIVSTKTIPTTTSTEPIDVPAISSSAVEPIGVEESFKMPCFLYAFVSEDQQNCWNRSGVYSEISLDGGYGCDHYGICFLPSGSTEVNPDGVIAKDPSECIFIQNSGFNKDNKLFCAADSTNIRCPEGIECTFTEFLRQAQKDFDGNLSFYRVDLQNYDKSVTLPIFNPSLPAAPTIRTHPSPIIIPEDKICHTINDDDDDDDDDDESYNKKLCEERNGYYIELGISFSECRINYACFLPSGSEELLFNAIIASNKNECIEIEGKYYCAVDLTNIRCKNGMRCTFSSFVLEAYNIFGENFKFNFIDPSNTTEPIVVPKSDNSALIPVDLSSPIFKLLCYDSPKDNEKMADCKRRHGEYLDITFSDGQPFDFQKEGENVCQQYTVCFLPEGSTQVHSDGIIAKDSSECILLGSNLNRFENRLFCAADLTNITCMDGEKCPSFTEFINQVQQTFGTYFTSINVDFNKISKSIILPVMNTTSSEITVTTTDVSDIGITPTSGVDIPKREKCERDLSDLYENNKACKDRNGYFIRIAYEPECGNTKYACFLPVGTEKFTLEAIIAESHEECIEIEGEYYCAADITSIVCPKKEEGSTSALTPTWTSTSTSGSTSKCSFSEFVMEVHKIFGDYFIYNSIDKSKAIETIKVPNPLDYVVEPEEKNTTFKFGCFLFAMVTEDQSRCWSRGGKYFEIALDDGYGCNHYGACFLPEGTTDIDSESIVAKDASECVFIPKNKNDYDHPLFCSVDSTNISCPDRKECTFTEFVKYAQDLFGVIFTYYNVDIQKYNKPVTLPTINPSTTATTARPHPSPFTISEDRICHKEGGNESKYERLCKERNGYYIELALNPFCANNYACFLPSGSEELLFNAIIATNINECIEIEGKHYCAADLTNIGCNNGMRCTFSNFVLAAYNRFGEYFKFNFVDPSNSSTEAIVIPKSNSSALLPVDNNTFIFNPQCYDSSRDYEKMADCEGRHGEYFDITIKVQPSLDLQNEDDDDGICQQYTVCFLPEGSTQVHSDGIIAKDSSECVLLGSNLNRFENRLFCAADSTNITCTDGEKCPSFTDFLKQVRQTYGIYFSYISVDFNKISKPITLPVTDSPISSATLSTVTTKTLPGKIPPTMTTTITTTSVPVMIPPKIITTTTSTTITPSTTVSVKLPPKSATNTKTTVLPTKYTTTTTTKTILPPKSTTTTTTTKTVLPPKSTTTTTTTTKTVLPPKSTTTTTTTTKTVLPPKSTTTTTTTTKTVLPPKSTTTKTVPGKKPPNMVTTNQSCIPKTVTVTVKEVVTVTVQSPSNIRPSDNNCADIWAQCGGQGFNGPKCCKSGLRCHEFNQYYSQCLEN